MRAEYEAIMRVWLNRARLAISAGSNSARAADRLRPGGADLARVARGGQAMAGHDRGAVTDLGGHRNGAAHHALDKAERRGLGR